MTIKEIRAILANVEFRDRRFIVLTKGDGFLLQMHYDEPDTETRKMVTQHTRKWYISSHAMESEVVQTAMKCVLTSQEHIGREHFHYKGQNIFYPHWDVNTLVELRAKSKPVRRRPRTGAHPPEGGYDYSVREGDR